MSRVRALVATIHRLQAQLVQCMTAVLTQTEQLYTAILRAEDLLLSGCTQHLGSTMICVNARVLGDAG